MNTLPLISPFEGMVRVSSIRSKKPTGRGGCIFSGYEVNAQGDVVDCRKLIVVKAAGWLLPSIDAVERGEVWHVVGSSVACNRTHDGYRLTEVEVDASTLFKTRETGDVIVFALANNPSFRRVGMVRARKLWNKFGQRLYDILDNGDICSLRKVLDNETATHLIEAWQKHVSGAVYSFLQSSRLPAKLAKKVVDFYGSDTEKALKDDAYRLLSFSAPWPAVDALAQERFAMQLDDPRRLHAAVEESLYRLLDRQSHTAVPIEYIKTQLRKLLAIKNDPDGTERLIRKALDDSKGNGAYISDDSGLYWSVGAYAMEETIAERIVSMIKEPECSPTLFLSAQTGESIKELISQFETLEAEKLGVPFALTDEQRQAVISGTLNRFSVITGGAGTGKTMVLKCLYFVIGKLGYTISQMALSGLAAKRMQDSTGLRAPTIAGYLRKVEAAQEEEGNDSLYIIVDESSMLDLATTYRIFRTMSDGARMVLVGDPYQLPPIMAGLVFHILAETPGIPVVELTQVKRQAHTTGIPAVAKDIRFGTLPALPAAGPGGVKFISCKTNEIIPKTLEQFAMCPERTQIITALKRCPSSGTIALNDGCCKALSTGSREVLLSTNEKGTYCRSGYREGERIMFTKNDWQRQVNNGSIGHITEVVENPGPGDEDTDTIIAKAEFDDLEVPILESDILGDKPLIEHGYAVTVHKSQGSQWPRVIVPIKSSQILDRTLIYTAITRAEEEVILIGDFDALRLAVERPPAAHARRVGFGHLLRRKLASNTFTAAPQLAEGSLRDT